MKNLQRKNILLGILLLILLFVVGCGDSKKGEYVMGEHYYTGEDKNTEKVEETTTETEDSIEPAVDSDLFMIMKNDMTAELMILKQLASGKQYMYYYSTGTKFMDKYGDHTSVMNFDIGRVVTIGEKNSEGKLASIQISDDVWEYDDVTKFTMNPDYNMFSIAGTKYFYDGELLVNSDENVIELSDLTNVDQLRVIGQGKKVYSITVTTGHGTLALTNTDLFDGSYIQIGTKIFSEITPDMQIDLAEGTYTVAVANDGYGGSTDITVERGQTFTLDLDTLKGEGPKYSNVAFVVAADGATLLVDGQAVDYSQPVSLRYGVHSLQVTAAGYDTWSKYLYVNSAEATIVIDPSDTEDEEEETSSETTNNSSGSNTSNSTTNNGTSTNTGIDDSGTIRDSLDSNNTTDTTTNGNTTNSTTGNTTSNDSTNSSNTSNSNTDYLSTLSELISSFTKSNSN